MDAMAACERQAVDKLDGFGAVGEGVGHQHMSDLYLHRPHVEAQMHEEEARVDIGVCRFH
tara:strand:- start:300 stop:479 length:180 start_codon:yes stop_codon:yes gene_type:complete